MRRLQLAVIAALVLAVAVATVQAVGTVTVATTDVGGGAVRYAVDWTSTAMGAVSANKFSVIRGYLLQVKFVPDSGGTQPTDLYDVELRDDDNIDLLNDAGDNLSNSAGKIVSFNPPLFLDSTQQLDVVVANAGASKGGMVYVWVRP